MYRSCSSLCRIADPLCRERGADRTLRAADLSKPPFFPFLFVFLLLTACPSALTIYINRSCPHGGRQCAVSRPASVSCERPQFRWGAQEKETGLAERPGRDRGLGSMLIQRTRAHVDVCSEVGSCIHECALIMTDLLVLSGKPRASGKRTAVIMYQLPQADGQ
jgi:hypothetical protein